MSSYPYDKLRNLFNYSHICNYILSYLPISEIITFLKRINKETSKNVIEFGTKYYPNNQLKETNKKIYIIEYLINSIEITKIQKSRQDSYLEIDEKIDPEVLLLNKKITFTATISQKTLEKYYFIRTIFNDILPLVLKQKHRLNFGLVNDSFDKFYRYR